MRINVQLVNLADVIGATIVLVLSLICIIFSIKRFLANKDNVFVQYLLFLTGSLTFFSLSRGTAHILRHILVDVREDNATWQAISPYTGSLNTTAFIIIFSVSLFFWFFIRVHSKIEMLNISLARQAATDPLTGLFNRRELFDRIKGEIERSKRYNNSSFSLIICDIDFFKKYNDFYGHLAGDKCLKEVAKILSNNASRINDVVARYGGEEFVLLLPGINLEQANTLCQAIVKAIEEKKIRHEDSDVNPHVTLSFGIAQYDINMDTPEDILLIADKNLYKAKDQGRNSIVF